MIKKVIIFILCSLCFINVFASGQSSSINVKNYEKFLDSLALLNFVEDASLYNVDEKTLNNSLLSAVLKSLDDDYAQYIPEDESADFQSDLNGQYVGIGIVMRKDTDSGYVNIERVYPGSPARKNLIKVNDKVTKVFDEDVKDLELKAISKKIRGEKGSKVELEILRSGRKLKFIITRDLITIPSISYSMYKNDIGYIKINTFHKNTAEDFNLALIDLKKMGLKNLIIDLRYNYGGSVPEAINIADMLLDKNKIIIKSIFSDKRKKDNQTFKSRNTPLIDSDLPIIILSDKATASSSEILLLALKSNNRAKIIGETSYGKGIFQEIRPFAKGYIKYTAAYFADKDNNIIHKKGIDPDIKVEDISYSDEESIYFSSLIQDKKVDKFLEENPNYSKRNLLKFAKEFASKDIREETLMIFILNEYWTLNDYDVSLLLNPELDKSFAAALKELL